MFTARVVRFVQEELRQKGYRIGKSDGKLGRKTERALRRELAKVAQRLPPTWQDFPRTRLFTLYVQIRCQEEKSDPGPLDGYWGPQTDYAVNVIRQRIQNQLHEPNFRDSDELDPRRAHRWSRQTQQNMNKFFGPAGKHLTDVALPYPHRLSWNKNITIKKYTCHEKVHDSLLRILKRVHEHYGLEIIIALRLDSAARRRRPIDPRGSRTMDRSIIVAISPTPRNSDA